MPPNEQLYHRVRERLERFAACYHRLEVTGREHLPAQGGALLCPRHENFSDPVFLAIAVQHRLVHYLAWHGIEEMPWLGEFFRKVGNVHCIEASFGISRDVDGTRRVLQTLEQLLRQGEWVAVFPEGNINQWLGPGGLKPFRSGAVRLAAMSQVPIIPVGLTGTRWVIPNLLNLHDFHGPDFNILIPAILPSKVKVRFGEPFHVAPLAAFDKGVARAETDRLRQTTLHLIQSMRSS